MPAIPPTPAPNPHIDRIAQQLRCDAALRDWAARRLPGDDPLAARAWLLALAADMIAGRVPTLGRAARAAGLSPETAQALCSRWRAAGLLAAPAHPAAPVPGAAAVPGAAVADDTPLPPTTAFMALLDDYVDQAEHWAAPRLPQRSAHLVCRVPPPLAAQVETWFDRFEDLGWIHEHHAGAMCFLMALLVREVARLHGHAARAVSGCLELDWPDRIYKIGGPVLDEPGAIAGHAFCVVDEVAVVDFGLGVARRGPLRAMYWGLAAPLRRAGGVLAELPLGPGRRAIWRDDWRHPRSEAEFAKYGAAVQRLAAHYARRYARRYAPGAAALPRAGTSHRGGGAAIGGRSGAAA